MSTLTATGADTGAVTAPPHILSARLRLQQYVARAVFRLRVQEALHAVLVASTLSLWLLAVLIFFDKLFSLAQIGIPVWIVWGAVTVLAVPYVLWRVFSPRIHENLAAVLADDRLKLNARLSTALTLDLSDPANAAFSEAFFAEALGKLQSLNVTQAFPIRVPRAYGLLLLPMLACGLLLRFMTPQDKLGLVKAYENKRKADAMRQKAASALEAKIEDLKKKVAEDGENANEKVKQFIQQAGNIANELKEGKRTPQEALAQLAGFKKDIQDEKAKLGKDFLERLEELKAQDLNLEDNALTKDVSEALKMQDPNLAAQQMRTLGKKIKDTLNDPEKTPEQKQKAMEQLQREVDRLAGALAEDEALREGLKELSQKSMSAADFQKLEEEVKKALEKEGKGRSAQDLEKQLEEVAQELERLAEDNDAEMSEADEKADNELSELEDGADKAMESMNNPEGNQSGEQQEGEKKGGQSGKSKQAGQKSGRSGGKKKVARGSKQEKSGGREQGGEEGKQGGEEGQAGGKGEEDKDGKPSVRPGDGLGGGKGFGTRPYREVADPGFEAQKLRANKIQSGAITGISRFRGQGAKGDAPAEFKEAVKAIVSEEASALDLSRYPADARDVVKEYFRNVRAGVNIPEEPPKPAVERAPKPAEPKKPATEALRE